MRSSFIRLTLGAINKRRFPPLIDTLCADPVRVHSDPAPEPTQAIEDPSEIDADYSVLRFSYNPSSAKVYVVRVPAVLESPPRKAAATSSPRIAAQPSAKGKDTTSRTSSELINAVLRGSEEEQRSATASESKPHMKRQSDVDALNSNSADVAGTAEDDIGMDEAKHTVRMISDVESKTVLRLSPNHVASLLSAMDPTIAAKYWQSRNKPECHQADAVDLAKHMMHLRKKSHLPHPLHSRDAGEESLRPHADRAPILAGRDLYAPSHVDDFGTFRLMRGPALEQAKQDTAVPTSASYAAAGPREFQWFIGEAAKTVTLVSTLTTRQYVLNTTGIFTLVTKGHMSQYHDGPKMVLKSVKFSGHIVDDSLLFFHCWGLPTVSMLVPANTSLSGPKGEPITAQEEVTAENIDSSKAAKSGPTPHEVLTGSKKRIWSPITLLASQALPIKAFLESSLDEALGFGGSEGIAFYGPEGNAPANRIVVPQSIMTHQQQSGSRLSESSDI